MSEENVVDLTKVTMEDLEKLRSKNLQKLQAIQQQGAALDPSGVANRRLELFLDLFLSDAQRVQFEYAFETKMTELLNEILSQLRTAMLTQGVGQAVNQNPSLILPNGA